MRPRGRKSHANRRAGVKTSCALGATPVARLGDPNIAQALPRVPDTEGAFASGGVPHDVEIAGIASATPDRLCVRT
jgi:hypothetical protein